MLELGLCIEMAFSKLPFTARIAEAAELGFENVEMWLVDGSFEGTPDELARIANDKNVKITNTVIDDPEGSISGGLANPEHRDRWVQRAKMAIEFTSRAQIPATIVCTGNEVEGMSREQMTDSVVEGLKPTIELAEKAGITLLLEPLNTPYDHPGYFCTSSDQGAEICRRIDSERMKMLFDCYHMQIMEGDLFNHIERNIDVIGHFHLAGVPGRNELFKSEINYPFLLNQIEALGFRGLAGLEYMPTMDDVVSLKETLKYLSVSGN